MCQFVGSKKIPVWLVSLEAPAEEICLSIYWIITYRANSVRSTVVHANGYLTFVGNVSGAIPPKLHVELNDSHWDSE